MSRLQKIMDIRRAYVAKIGQLATAIFREFREKDPPTTFVAERYWVKVDSTFIKVEARQRAGAAVVTVRWPDSLVQVHVDVTDEELAEVILVLTDLLSDDEVY